MRIAWLTTLFVIGLVASAQAQTTRIDRGLPDGERTSALDGMSQLVRAQHQPFSETLETARNGRVDRVFYVHASWDEVLNYYHVAFAQQTQLPGGVRCAGYNFQANKRRATFTLYRGSQRFLLSAYDSGDSTRLVLMGNPTRSPFENVVRRHHVGMPQVAPRRPGL